MTSPRRNVLRMIAATPFIAGGVKTAEEVMSAKERADFHYAEFAKAMNELTADFDGWNLYAGKRKAFEYLEPVDTRSFQTVKFSLDNRNGKPMVVESHSVFRV